MNGKLVINPYYCTGCGICELVCALYHNQQWDPALARLRVINDRHSGIHVPVACVHCEDPSCMFSCLMNIIYRDERKRWVLRRAETCIGCRACEANCPFGAVKYHYLDDVVVSCDFCGGRPLCAEYCPEAAIRYISLQQEVEERRIETALLTARLARVIEEESENG